MGRITKRFAELKAGKRAGLVAYVSAGDPDAATGYEILKGLPAAGADLIELGMPFTDPMADGPSVQAAGQRALKAGITVDATFDMVRRFRREVDNDTPILLMGYYNLVYQRGPERFCKEASAAGVDGFILVDLPPEEADELKPHALASSVDTVLLTAPTTDDKRLPAVLKYASGFVYFVSVLGITGTKSATEDAVAHARRAYQAPYQVAGRRRLRNQDAGPGRGGRASRRRRRCRLGDRRSRESGSRCRWQGQARSGAGRHDLHQVARRRCARRAQSLAVVIAV